MWECLDDVIGRRYEPCERNRYVNICIAQELALRGVFFLMIVCGLLAFPVQAEIYKWVGPDGKMVFSDAPPPAGKGKADVVKTDASPVAGRKDTDWMEKEREFRIRNIDKAGKECAVRQERDKACAQAKLKGERLKRAEGVMLYRTDKEGERVFIGDDEREAIAKKVQQDITENCSR